MALIVIDPWGRFLKAVAYVIALVCLYPPCLAEATVITLWGAARRHPGLVWLICFGLPVSGYGMLYVTWRFGSALGWI